MPKLRLRLSNLPKDDTSEGSSSTAVGLQEKGLGNSAEYRLTMTHRDVQKDSRQAVRQMQKPTKSRVSFFEGNREQRQAIEREMEEIVQKEEDFDNPMNFRDLANSQLST